jgi:hypothetical protein
MGVSAGRVAGLRFDVAMTSWRSVGEGGVEASK